MSIRFSDNILDNIEDTGFVPRQRVPKLLQVLVAFLLVFDLICFTAYVTDDESVNAVFLLVLICSLSALGCLACFFLYRLRRVILSTEFHNAMLASAAQIGTRFCFITNADGVIYYIDYGFQKTFANFMGSGSRNLKELALFTEMTPEVSERISDVLRSGKSGSLTWSFQDTSGTPMTVVLMVDALPRPSGYFMIRGRDFVQKRHSAVEDKQFQEQRLLVLEESIATLSDGALVADQGGRILQASTSLERSLGYEAGEISHGNMQVRQIFHQYVGHEAGTLLLNHFEGEIILQHRDKRLITRKARQRLLSVNGKTIGICVLLALHDS